MPGKMRLFQLHRLKSSIVFTRGVALRNLKRPTEALSSLDRALARFDLGVLEAGLGRLREAAGRVGPLEDA